MKIKDCNNLENVILIIDKVILATVLFRHIALLHISDDCYSHSRNIYIKYLNKQN